MSRSDESSDYRLLVGLYLVANPGTLLLLSATGSQRTLTFEIGYRDA